MIIRHLLFLLICALPVIAIEPLSPEACEQEKQAILEAIQPMATCQESSDCTYVAMNKPFPQLMPISKESNPSPLRALIKEFQSKCDWSRHPALPEAPPAELIVCENQLCKINFNHPGD